MPPFALIASKAGLETTDRIDQFSAAAAAQDWRTMPLSRSVVLAVGPGTALDVRSLGTWRLIGDVFPRRDRTTGEPQSAADLTPIFGDGMSPSNCATMEGWPPSCVILPGRSTPSSYRRPIIGS